MSATRVALANSTNSPRSSSRPASTRFISKLSSRKSAPTCTVSLANVSANDLCISFESISSSSPFHSPTNLIPFPSSPAESLDIAISQPDRTCLSLLRSSPEGPLQPRARSSPALRVPQERRKRATMRLSQPIPSPSPELCSAAEPLQPPRKRPRLIKSAKPARRVSPVGASDLRFMANFQRCVAGGVIERRPAAHARHPEHPLSILETQDRLLASRLRTRLLAQGLKVASLIDLDLESDQCCPMDVDTSPHHTLGLSDDMDIVVESPTGDDVSASTAVVSSPPPRWVPPLVPDAHLNAPKIVAALFMRHHARRSSRSTSRSERTGASLEVQRPSPLGSTL